MEQWNKLVGPARPILQIVAVALLCATMAKYFGVSIPQIRGEWWQLAILALAVRAL